MYLYGAAMNFYRVVCRYARSLRTCRALLRRRRVRVKSLWVEMTLRRDDVTRVSPTIIF